MDPDHTHKWRAAGIWNGKTAEGRPTGGQWYTCDVCQMKVNSLGEAQELGGDIADNTDIFGRELQNDQ